MEARTLRLVGAAAAAASALLYYLIGFGVLYIGESTNGQDPGLLGFGLTAGTTFLVAGLLVVAFPRRWLLALIALLDLAVIVAYFAMGSIRDPSFELWGLLVKLAQAIFLLALAFLLLRGGEAQPSARFR